MLKFNSKPFLAVIILSAIIFLPPKTSFAGPLGAFCSSVLGIFNQSNSEKDFWSGYQWMKGLPLNTSNLSISQLHLSGVAHADLSHIPHLKLNFLNFQNPNEELQEARAELEKQIIFSIKRRIQNWYGVILKDVTQAGVIEYTDSDYLFHVDVVDKPLLTKNDMLNRVFDSETRRLRKGISLRIVLAGSADAPTVAKPVGSSEIITGGPEYVATILVNGIPHSAPDFSEQKGFRVVYFWDFEVQ